MYIIKVGPTNGYLVPFRSIEGRKQEFVDFCKRNLPPKKTKGLKGMIKETNAPEETFAFGKMLGEQAKPGEVICLNGDLGVGKTVLRRALLRDSESRSR